MDTLQVVCTTLTVYVGLELLVLAVLLKRSHSLRQRIRQYFLGNTEYKLDSIQSYLQDNLLEVQNLASKIDKEILNQKAFRHSIRRRVLAQESKLNGSFVLTDTTKANRQ
jgi:hypothetical protein